VRDCDIGVRVRVDLHFPDVVGGQRLGLRGRGPVPHPALYVGLERARASNTLGA